MACYVPKVTQQGWRSCDSHLGLAEPQNLSNMSPCEDAFKITNSYAKAAPCTSCSGSQENTAS